MTTDAGPSVQHLEGRIDKLTQALLHVAGELWVARDRQAVLERLLVEGGTVKAGAVDGYRPQGALAEALTTEREAFIAALLAYLAPDA